MDWIKEKDNLIDAINQNESYESLGRKYGVCGAYIKKICKNLWIFIKDF